MKDLYLSELRRFRALILAVAATHLLVLLFINRTTDLLQQPFSQSTPLLAAYLMLGVVLAVIQVGSYRKPSQWLWLMHRPLAPPRIFAALMLAALTMLATVMLLPMLVLVLGTDLFTTRVVDVRHYVALLHLLAFAMMAWLAGAHAIISRSKAAIAVIAGPVLLALHLVSVWWLWLPVSLTLAWLGYITMRSFRANREAPIQGTATLLLTALPLQLGIFLLAFQLGQFLFVTGGILLGTDALNTEYPPRAGLIATQRAEPNDEIAMGLAHSQDPRAASWRAQLPLLEPLRFGPFLTRFPIRQQLGNLQIPTQWFDQKHDTLWTFSHDRMLFRGRNPESGADHGWWGVGGAGDMQPFAQIPVVTGDGYLLTRNALYAIDDEAQRQHELLRLPPGEAFTDVPHKAFNRLLVLTSRNLRAYRSDPRAASRFAPLSLEWQQPLPRGAENLEGTSVAQLMDGWLVSFLYGEGYRQIGFSHFNTVAQPWQQVVFIDDDGHSRAVGERDIQRDYPALYQVAWWLSPALQVLSEWPDSTLDKGLTWPLRQRLLPDVPVFYPVALGLMLLSLVLAAWWLRGTRAAPARRRLWLAVCGLIGLPAVATLVLLEPRR